MRSIPLQLLEHYKGHTLTLAMLWKITRIDNAVYGFTDVDKDIYLDGVLYKANTGFVPSAIDTKSNFGVDNLDVSSVLSDDSITEKDLKLGLWDGARIELFEVNYEDVLAGKTIKRKGYLGEVKSGRQTFYGELRGLAQRLQTQVGRIYNPACDADLGDDRCKVDLTPLRRNLTITNVLSRTFMEVDPGSVVDLNDTYFANGLVVFLTGANAGFKSEVAFYNKALGRFRFYIQPPYPMEDGDTFEATPGCLKDVPACKRFGNLLNHQGFPDVPGADKLVSGK